MMAPDWNTGAHDLLQGSRVSVLTHHLSLALSTIDHYTSGSATSNTTDHILVGIDDPPLFRQPRLVTSKISLL